MDCAQPGCSGIRVLTDLFIIMERSNASTFNEKLEFMEWELLNEYAENDQNIGDVKKKMTIIRHQFKQRWSSARNTKARFLENNTEWLKGCISVPKAVTAVSPGRPQKSFLDLSERSKRRKTEALRSSDTDELTYATQMKLRDTGKLDASKIVKDLTKSPRRARNYAEAMKKSTAEEEQGKSNKLKHLRALFMFVEAGLTGDQYEIVRDTNPSFYPCYSILQNLKKECYPEIQKITETCAEVKLQHRMDHTARRLIIHLGEAAAEQLTESDKQSLMLISKWLRWISTDAIQNEICK